MKDYETERARQEHDSIAITATVMIGGLGLVLLWVGYVLPFAGRVALVVVLGAILTIAVLRQTKDGDVAQEHPDQG